MMKRFAAGMLLGIFAATLSAGCKRQREETGPFGRPEQRQADAAAARRIVDTGISAVNARNLDAVLVLYADDAVLLPPDGEAVLGKQAIKAYYQSTFEDLSPELSFSSEEIITDNAWAFSRGKAVGRVTSTKTGAARSVNEKYIMILRRQPDGSWRIARLMWNR